MFGMAGFGTRTLEKDYLSKSMLVKIPRFCGFNCGRPTVKECYETERTASTFAGLAHHLIMLPMRGISVYGPSEREVEVNHRVVARFTVQPSP